MEDWYLEDEEQRHHDAKMVRLAKEKHIHNTMLGALEYIAGLEPGSRGAYSKFMQAKERACEAVAVVKGGDS